MTNCPKCDGQQIMGPKYLNCSLFGESLLYTCFRCGYAERWPTKDANKPQKFAEPEAPPS
jgi:RNase P subunit RPR2